MIFLKNIIAIITDPKNTRMFLLGGIVVLCFLLFRQCEQTDIAKSEATKISNNWKASLDTIENYVDKNGNAAAEIRALNLTLEEIEDELEFEKDKPPLTIIKTETVIKEVIVEVPVNVIDTILGNFNSALTVSDSATWGKSFRGVGVFVPYEINGDLINFGNATIDLKQNIFLSASLTRDNKTKELFVNLLTDYPGTTFNSAEGILIDQRSSAFKSLQYENRKTLGLGLQLGVGFNGNGVAPYVGIGLNYTPKFLQW
tara:strand:+ start:6231 stop:7001 length:771 start_codon:yes stop_codon:yes gene_type:complete